MKKAPTRKAAGIDEVKTEMLKVDTEMSTNLLYEVWGCMWTAAWGFQSSWMKALLVPIYKKGDQDDPKNHKTNISPEPSEKNNRVGSRLPVQKHIFQQFNAVGIPERQKY